jgi:hypothetical protein
LHNEVVHPFAKRLNLYMLNNFVGESEHEHQPCLALVYAA